MSIGLRIISNNLIGKTASVTFTPASGGTPQNLGIKTIPFNNITPYPYGTYDINVLEYNYIYNLSVPEPSPLQSGYTTTVRNVINPEGGLAYSSAILSESWGEYTTGFITSKGYSPNDIIYAEGICSDDVDGPVFTSVDNIGQFPTSMNTFLGPFMSGGLAGFPFVGTVGLGAWASHITSTGTLFITSTPHIGVTIDGRAGRMFRKGKSDSLTDNTCGAVAGAIGQVLTTWSADTPTFDFYSGSGDYEFFKLIDILWPFSETLSGFEGTDEEIYNQQMVFATNKIKENAFTYLFDNLSTVINNVLSSRPSLEIFLSSGIFINTDYEYESYVNIDQFWKYSINDGWTDLTSEYVSGLPL
jgi:hypothetical protein